MQISCFFHSNETFYILYYCITSIVDPNSSNIYQQILYKENIIYVLGDFSFWVLHDYRMQRVLLWQFIKCKVGLINVLWKKPIWKYFIIRGWHW